MLFHHHLSGASECGFGENGTERKPPANRRSCEEPSFALPFLSTLLLYKFAPAAVDVQWSTFYRRETGLLWQGQGGRVAKEGGRIRPRRPTLSHPAKPKVQVLNN